MVRRRSASPRTDGMRIAMHPLPATVSDIPSGAHRRVLRAEHRFASDPPVSQDRTEHRGHGGISRTRATVLTWTYWTR
jgi:hypothetical protein